MKKLRNIIYLGIILLLSSCTITGPVVKPQALVTQNSVGDKVGIAERTVWFGFSFGHTDLSTTTAAKAGGISKIATVDSYYRKGLFKTKYKTIVTGE